MFNINPKKVGSLNEGGRRLKVGTFAYEITNAAMVPVKSDPRGKEQQILFELCTRDGYSCRLYLSVMSANEVQCEIAQKTLVAIWEAAGLNGNIKPDTLKRLSGKVVVIETKETKGKGDNKDKTYVNVVTVEAYDPEEDGGGDRDEDGPDPEGDDSSNSGEEEQEEEEESDPEPEPEPKPTGKAKRPWG